jgi:hypothetical protein
MLSLIAPQIKASGKMSQNDTANASHLRQILQFAAV